MADRADDAPHPWTCRAPVFRPSEEEFADFEAFVTSIEPACVDFGIAKIVPPASWRPPPSAPLPSSFLLSSPTLQTVDAKGHGRYHISHRQCPSVTLERFERMAASAVRREGVGSANASAGVGVSEGEAAGVAPSREAAALFWSGLEKQPSLCTVMVAADMVTLTLSLTLSLSLSLTLTLTLTLTPTLTPTLTLTLTRTRVASPHRRSERTGNRVRVRANPHPHPHPHPNPDPDPHPHPNPDPDSHQELPHWNLRRLPGGASAALAGGGSADGSSAGGGSAGGSSAGGGSAGGSSAGGGSAALAGGDSAGGGSAALRVGQWRGLSPLRIEEGDLHSLCYLHAGWCA